MTGLLLVLCTILMTGCRDWEPVPAPQEEEEMTEVKFGSVIEAGESDTLEDLTARAEVAVLDFNATWCGPCKMLRPKIDEMAAEFPGVCFVSVDADKCRKAVEAAGDVLSLPCVVVYVRGKEAGRVVGFNPSGVRREIESAVEESR